MSPEREAEMRAHAEIDGCDDVLEALAALDAERAAHEETTIDACASRQVGGLTAAEWRTRAEKAERERDEALAALAALREILKITADCLPMEHAQRDRAIRVYFGKPAALAGQVRARVLREAATICDANATRYHDDSDVERADAMGSSVTASVLTGAAGGSEDCAARLRALADEAERAR